MADPDDIRIEREERDSAIILRPIGDIDLSRAPSLRVQLGAAISEAGGRVVINLAEVPYMDSSGVATFVEAMQIARRRSRELVLCGMQDRVRSIFEIARLDTVFRITGTLDEAMEEVDDATDTPDGSMVTRGLIRWGAVWANTLRSVGGVTYLILDVLSWLRRGLFTRRVRLGRAAIHTQIVRIGVRSIGIVVLVNACIGFILALQMQPPLADFGQTDKIANIIGVAVFRELGPLVSAIVLAGFAGAAIAAELGTMVVGEEIEALEAHALNPVRFLVVPRVFATIVSLVALTVVGDLAGVTFGGVMTVGFLGVPYGVYMANTLDQLVLNDFFTGLFKAACFGLILSAIACHNGLRVSGGAAGVGRATTDTVVQTIVTVIMADLLFTSIFYSLGIT